MTSINSVPAVSSPPPSQSPTVATPPVVAQPEVVTQGTTENMAPPMTDLEQRSQALYQPIVTVDTSAIDIPNPTTASIIDLDTQTIQYAPATSVVQPATSVVQDGYGSGQDEDGVSNTVSGAVDNMIAWTIEDSMLGRERSVWQGEVWQGEEGTASADPADQPISTSLDEKQHYGDIDTGIDYFDDQANSVVGVVEVYVDTVGSAMVNEEDRLALSDDDGDSSNGTAYFISAMG